MPADQDENQLIALMLIFASNNFILLCFQIIGSLGMLLSGVYICT